MRFAVNGEKLALVAGLLACIQGCALAGVQLSGRVIDAETGDPVAGAYVYAESGHKEICILDNAGCSSVTVDSGLTRTGDDGSYQFDQRFHFGVTLADKFGKIFVYKPGLVTALKMVNSNWDVEFQTPEQFITRTAVIQYFYGTGSYRHNYKDVPWDSRHTVYYLTSRPISELLGSNSGDRSSRLTYLSNVANQLKGHTSKIHPMEEAVYEEAKSLAESPKEKRIVRSICFDVFGMSSILNKNEACPP